MKLREIILDKQNDIDENINGVNSDSVFTGHDPVALFTYLFSHLTTKIISYQVCA